MNFRFKTCLQNTAIVIPIPILPHSNYFRVIKFIVLMPDIARPFLLHPLFFQNFLTLESAYQPEITFDILIRITLNL